MDDIYQSLKPGDLIKHTTESSLGIGIVWIVLDPNRESRSRSTKQHYVIWWPVTGRSEIRAMFLPETGAERRLKLLEELLDT